MFVKLFISKWRHPNVDVRINAVSKLNPSKPSHAGKLWQMALHDTHDSVRKTAIASLSDTQQLLTLLQNADDLLASQTAAKRLGELLEQQQIALDLLEQLDSASLLRLLCACAAPEVHRQASPLIEEQGALASLAMHASLAITRQEAARRLTDPQFIDQVGQYAKLHDKAVYRLIKAQQKQLQQQEIAIDQAKQNCEAIINQLTELIQNQSDRTLSQRFEHLVKQWQDCAAWATQTQLTQFQQMSSQVAERLVLIHAAEQALSEQRIKETQINAALGHLRSEMGLMFALQETPDTDVISQSIQTWFCQLDDLEVEIDNPEQQRQCQSIREVILLFQQLTSATTNQPWTWQAIDDMNTIDACSAALEELEHSYQAFRKWPQNWPKPAMLQTWEQQRHALQSRLETLRQQETETQLARQQQQQQLMAEKELLCIAMEALLDKPLPEAEKARQIKHLQQRWKALDQQSQGAVKALWDRFHRASTLAYAPCELYFREQHRLRAWNLSQRQAICQLLEQHFETIDWSRADWTALEQLLKQAKQEWRHFTPVDRAPGKQLQTRFNDLLKHAETALSQHREHCALAKQAIIEEAEQLASVTTGEFAEATQRFKALQQEWKQIDSTDHKRERQLWKAFREQGDRLFDRLREHQQSPREEINARLLCVQLEILLNQPSPDSDQYLRMEYQMQRLEAALETPTAEAQALALEQLIHTWTEHGFTQQFPNLNSRFQQLLRQNKAL